MGGENTYGPVKVVSGGAPKAWFQDDAYTPGCIACKALAEKGLARSKVHSKGCKVRCKKWLEEELQKRIALDRERKRKRDTAEVPPMPEPVLPMRVEPVGP